MFLIKTGASIKARNMRVTVTSFNCFSGLTLAHTCGNASVLAWPVASLKAERLREEAQPFDPSRFWPLHAFFGRRDAVSAGPLSNLCTKWNKLISADQMIISSPENIFMSSFSAEVAKVDRPLKVQGVGNCS